MEELKFEERLANYVRSMSEYEFRNLVARMNDYRTELPDGIPEWLHRPESRREALATLLNMMRTPDGLALLLPWIETNKVSLSFSAWLKESTNRGFRKGLDSDSVKRIFAERVKVLVEEEFILRTVEGYAPAPGTRKLLSDTQELIDLGIEELD
jgi:hypothetical protein